MNTKTTWLLVAFAALAVGSCTAKNQYAQLEITKLIPPVSPVPLDGGAGSSECAFSSSTKEYSFQVFNTSRDFFVGIVVENNLPNNANINAHRLNTNDFLAMSAIITYEATDGSSISVTQQVTPTQGLVPASGSSVVGAVLIPAAVATKLAAVQSVRLHMHIEGRLLDGSTITSNEYLPIALPTASATDTSSCVASF